MASKFKVIENPSEADILRRIGGKYRPDYSRDDLFPIRNFYPMWTMYNLSRPEPFTDESIILGCNYTPGKSEEDANFLGSIILEKEEGPLKVMFWSDKAPIDKWPKGFRYDCQVYGHPDPFEITFPYEESPVHQLAVYLAFGNGAYHEWGHKYSNRFKAIDYLGKKLSGKDFLQFCGIKPESMAGGSYGFNGYDLYWTNAKGIELQKRDKDTHRMTWTEIASAFTDILGFVRNAAHSAQPPAGEVMKVWKQVALF
jgi:hypothetical protein